MPRQYGSPDDGLTCVATIYGYAGLIDGARDQSRWHGSQFYLHHTTRGRKAANPKRRRNSFPLGNHVGHHWHTEKQINPLRARSSTFLASHRRRYPPSGMMPKYTMPTRILFRHGIKLRAALHVFGRRNIECARRHSSRRSASTFAVVTGLRDGEVPASEGLPGPSSGGRDSQIPIIYLCRTPLASLSRL